LSVTSAELATLYFRDLSRLIQQIGAFPTDAMLWQTVPGVTNPAGNLALHLEGNLREFIGRRLGQVAYSRNRPLEFSNKEVPKQELIARLEDLRAMLPSVIASLAEPALEAEYPETVLETPLSNLAFLIHLYGHLNWHLGQLDYLRRVLSGDGAIQLAGL